MSSNCYIIWDDVTKLALIIDPASQMSLHEMAFLTNNGLHLDFIILTHEHTDHTWGVNSLLKFYPDCKVIASQACKEELPHAEQAYFCLYMDDPQYEYYVERVDITTEKLNWKLFWSGYTIEFIPTPGHSSGSMSIILNNMMFSGDTLMQYKPHNDKKTGTINVLMDTIDKLMARFDSSTMVYPGHGDAFRLCDYTYPLK